MTTKNDPLVGTRYDGRYRVERRIGAGGMANVYLAEDETLGRRVAIKVLHQRYAEDSQFVERFLREASAAARLNHPNIVQVYDRGQSDGSYYIAMEYVDGLTLKDLIRRRGALTEQEVFAYGRQALHALRFAHRNGIVHRDVKPHNMMVDTDGRLKIADFGIARAGSDTGLTEAGSIVGTAQYLSPEQARGLEVNASSDLYSLGIVMYEMSTGQVPFDGDSPVGVALKHVNDEPARPRSINPSISSAIESIILTAIAKDPARRYATADEMLADLDSARTGGTGAATRVLPAAAGGGHRPVEPATMVTPAAARAAYVQPVGPEPAWPDTADDRDDRRRDRGRGRGRRRALIAAIVLVVLAIAGAGGWMLARTPTDPVPDVVGQQLDDARSAITDAGFRVGKVDHEFGDEASGTVLEQDPGSGEAEEGSAIDLVVSDGPKPVAVPDVVGMPRQAAIAAITEAGLPKPRVRMLFDDAVTAGVVLAQTPSAAKEVGPDTVMTLSVSKGVEELDVPDVVGTNVDEARRRLEEAGFVVADPVEQSSTEAAGTVLAQDPAADAPADKGTTVTLTVASGSNEVPDVVGLPEADATAKLEEAGFVADVSTVPDPALVPGNDDIVVGEQEPSSGETLELGDSVAIVIHEPTGETPAPETPTPAPGT